LIIIHIYYYFHLMILYKMYYFNDYIKSFFKKNFALKCFPISLKFFFNLVPILSYFIFTHFIFIMIHFLYSNHQYFWSECQEMLFLYTNPLLLYLFWTIGILIYITLRLKPIQFLYLLRGIQRENSFLTLNSPCSYLHLIK
jgi:hypothetical protein